RAGRRADPLRLREREPLRHPGPARRVRRRAGGGAPEPLRRAVPLARQPAEARALAGREPHRLPGRAHLHLQAAEGGQVPRRRRDHRGGRALQRRAHPRHEEGRGLPALHHDHPRATKALDRHTVQFTLTKPAAIFMAVIPEIHVVNSALVKKNEKDGDWAAAWLTNNEAGSGSYMLTRYDPAIGFTAKRFPGHFMPWGAKSIDEIDFRFVKEDNTRVLGMIKGDYQGTGGYLPNDQVKRLREAPNVKIIEQESMRIKIFQINNQRLPLNDVHVRRAISYAFDYDGFNKDILGGSVERNPVPIPNNMWGVPRDVKGYTYDIDK